MMKFQDLRIIIQLGNFRSKKEAPMISILTSLAIAHCKSMGSWMKSSNFVPIKTGIAVCKRKTLFFLLLETSNQNMNHFGKKI